MSKLPIFERFLSVGNLKPKLKWFLRAETQAENFSIESPPREQLIVPPEKIGFPNIGNTCYFNAVLQCLFALPAFVESVVEWCDLIDAAADGSDDKENTSVGGGRYRLLRATRMLAKVKIAGKQGEVR